MADPNDWLTDGKINKMEVDYSATVDIKIPECEKLAQNGKLEEAIDTLFVLEKQTRTGADAISTGKILVTIARICYEAKRFDLLNEHIMTMIKKRGQLKQAVTKMVQEVFTYIDKIDDMPTKLKLIDALRTVTTGKIYVENERARLSLILSKIREDEGNITEAAAVLQELQVETFGTMEKQEKVNFILEQMRLCLLKKDYVRAQIVSKKINVKYFEEKDTHEQKLKFYKLMIELDSHEGSYLSICKHYLAVYNTPVIKEDPIKRDEVLTCVALYLILSPHDNEQHDLIHRIQQDPIIEELPYVKDLLQLFTTTELMRWKALVDEYESKLRDSFPAIQIFDRKSEAGNKRWKDFKSRLVEHNIRVMASYYTRITICRMAELLDLSCDEAEEFLSTSVVSKTIEARIDRLDGVVCFRRSKEPNDLLNDWSHNINQLMDLINKTTHLITKEEMVHKLW
ncbi:hypothetical protein HELRODRAFT_185452 [Helobdella robusta]|uniref:PCI domain-containing protein n=1 Tax=Helobdella robusta TaxID=6412 RepID=T1FMU3_HELRO|nr:hypothetical protein HELRODRAFT_185452 [Helobdella robusta]ESO07161.1 hypothetical protein HELRODRAFT_185452 [Helobdella robusta]